MSAGPLPFTRHEKRNATERLPHHSPDGFAVFARGSGENEVEHLLRPAEGAWVPDADAKAPEVGRSELGGDALEAVVAGVAAALLEFHRSGEKIEFVVNYEDLRGRDLVVGSHGLHGDARAVHEGGGLQEPHVFSLNAHAGGFSGKLPVFGKASAVLFGEKVEHLKAAVVPRGFILRTGIAEPDDQADG